MPRDQDEWVTGSDIDVSDQAVPDPARSADGRYLIINGRRWRASDPGIPANLRGELVNELMAARRAVRDARSDETALGLARNRVQDAKVALGERGQPWWEPPSEDGLGVRIAATIRALLRHREPESTICPSDAARVCGGPTWREAMDAARAVAAALAAAGVVEVRQHGRRVEAATGVGAIRLARGPRWPAGG